MRELWRFGINLSRTRRSARKYIYLYSENTRNQAENSQRCPNQSLQSQKRKEKDQHFHPKSQGKERKWCQRCSISQLLKRVSNKKFKNKADTTKQRTCWKEAWINWEIEDFIVTAQERNWGKGENGTLMLSLIKIASQLCTAGKDDIIKRKNSILKQKLHESLLACSKDREQTMTELKHYTIQLK